jgi:2',3'-cyclic-nucleotide 2'-phosphodiesterase (5'-nucleotidase family)
MLGALLAGLSLIAPADSVLLRVLSIGDFHGALESRVHRWSDGRPVGGIAALKGLMDSLAAECACPTLRLDAGDQMQGTLASNLVFGRSAVEAMNLLGLDAAVVGNHDLDWGRDTLRVRMRQARYPWIAANIVDSARGAPVDWIAPSHVLTTGGLRVGVVGYANTRTKQMVIAERVKGLVFPGGRAAIDYALEQLRRERVDLTVIVAHEGAFCDGEACAGDIVELAHELDSTEVQLIVAGHTHSLVNTTVNGIPIVAARSSSTALGVADLVAMPDGSRRWRVRVEDVYADRVTPDSAALALVERYRPEVERLAGVVIAEIGDSLTTVGAEYALGNLIADAQRAAAGADFGMMNNGGIRRDLLPGTLTYGDLYELHPFGNVVVEVTVTGAQMKEIVEHALRLGRPRFHLSGLVVRYDVSRSVGQRVVEMRDGRGRRVEPGRRYTLALSDFLAGGGDGLPVVPGLPAATTGRTDFDAMTAYLRSLPQPVRGPADRRFIPVNE